MNTNIKERISALADGELSEFEVRRVLDEIEKKPDLRNYWDLLQITRRSLANEDLGKLEADVSSRVRRELLGRKPYLAEENSSHSRYKNFLAASAGLALVFGLNFFLTTTYTDDNSFSEEASRTIANAIASPEAMDVLNNSVLGMDARLKDFNYVSGGGMHANYVFPEDGKKFRVSLSPVISEYKPKKSPELRRVFIKTEKGVFVVSVSGNITDEKKLRILQNANYFSNQIK
jgi:hypothetical protein